MSNVLERERGISEMEFYHTADEIRKELPGFVMSEKNVPKKWRIAYSVPIVQMVEALFDNMADANNIYPYRPEEVEQRKALQQECIRICDRLYERLQFGVTVIWWDTLHRSEDDRERIRLENRLMNIGALLDRELALLKGWKKSTRLLKRR